MRNGTKAEQMRQEALNRAINGLSMANYAAIIEGFKARGIPESEIQPRSNVFTYKAWQALGRQVRRGEKGVKILTFIPTDEGETSKSEKSKSDEKGKKHRNFARPWSVTVFHISQTEKKEPKRYVRAEAPKAAPSKSEMPKAAPKSETPRADPPAVKSRVRPPHVPASDADYRTRGPVTLFG